MSDADKGIFWSFVLARADPPTLKFLVAEAFGVSVQHLYIAWPDFHDGPQGIACLHVVQLTGGDFPLLVNVSSVHSPPVGYVEFGQRLSAAMGSDILLDGGTRNYYWMVLITPSDPPRRVCVLADPLDREEYVVALDPGPEIDPDLRFFED